MTGAEVDSVGSTGEDADRTSATERTVETTAYHGGAHQSPGRRDGEPDPAARRRAADAAAQAAEARAADAAAAAKTAIAAAARAAAVADDAAQEAERADADARDAAAAEARVADVRAAEARLRAVPAFRAAHAVPPQDAPRGPASHTRPEQSERSAADPTAAIRTSVPTQRARPEPAPSRHGDGREAGTREIAGADPAAGGRAARRRAASAETSVFAAVGAAPETAVEDPPVDEVTPRRRLFRRPTPPVLAAAAAGGVLALAGVLFAGGAFDQPSPEPAAVVESAPAAPAVPVLPSSSADTPSADPDGDRDVPAVDDGVDPLSDRAVNYLRELRAAGVPTSRGGPAETEAAQLVCEELDDGVTEEQIARALPASLPTVTRSQAEDLVTIARENYCN